MRFVNRLAPVLVLTAAAITGCSTDRATYNSTPHQPKSVAVVDTMTNQTLWSMDIPVNQKLTMNYSHDVIFELLWNPKAPPTTMGWALRPIDDRPIITQQYHYTLGDKSGSVDLPGDPVRTVVSMRPVEHPKTTSSQARSTPTPPPGTATTPASQGQGPANASPTPHVNNADQSNAPKQ